MFHDTSKSATVEQYLRKLSGQEKEPEIISIDHNYSKSWSSHPDSNHAKPARLLFMKGLQRYPHLLNGNENSEINVVTSDEPTSTPFDNPKVRHLMGECDRHLKYNPLLDDSEDREDNIRIAGWSLKQRRLYKQVLKVLQTDRLAKLAYAGTANEPIKRRLSIDKTARRLRQIYASVFWDMKLLSWLHQFLMDNINTSTLTVYLDALQTLKAKVPSLVDKMLSPMLQRSGTTDALSQLLKRQWDPLQPQLSHLKPRKLPGNPIFVVTPSSPTQQLPGSQTQRLRFWQNHLSSLGKVINVPIYPVNGNSSTSVIDCLEQIITAVRNKVVELKNHYPSRPVILIGWTIGALIACHVALEEEVTAIICLGFPLTGINGSRGDLDDPLLSNRIPTLFIVGQNANMCASDDVEDFRSRMKAESSLVIVGGADDVLRVSRMKKKTEGITQSIVDRCLVDEISDFLLMVLNVQLPSPSTTTPQTSAKYSTAVDYEEFDQNQGEEDLKRKRRKPREYSPELSPVKKRSKINAVKQPAPLATSKSRLSPCSESSSSGSCTEKSPVKSAVKKSGDKRVGRPATATWRKKLTIKPIIDPNQLKVSRTPVDVTQSPVNVTQPPINVTRASLNATQPQVNTALPLQPGKDAKVELIKPLAIKSQLKVLAPKPPSTPVLDTTPARPFPVKILEQKNTPVDVEKAFGKDSIFLPRSITPTEHEDTVSAEESESAMSELEKLANCRIIPEETVPEESSSMQSTSLLVEPLAMQNQSILATSNSEILASTASIVNIAEEQPIIVPKVLENEPKFISALKTTTGLRTVFPQAKILTTSALQNLRNNNSISLIASPQSSISTSGKQSYVLTMPSGNSTTFLVSSADGRTQQAKMIQLQRMPSKGSPVLAAKPPSLSSLLTSSSSSLLVPVSSAKESTEQQVCNLSLLSDVAAGISKPVQDGEKKMDASTATLVKLAGPDGTQSGTAIKCLKVIKSVAAPIRSMSPPVRQETQEEMVEKQLAIQALNKSIGIETPSMTRKEPGYSICYTKSDGSIVSRAVAKTNLPMYLPNAGPSRGRGRGRGHSLISMKEFQKMYHNS